MLVLVAFQSPPAHVSVLKLCFQRVQSGFPILISIGHAKTPHESLDGVYAGKGKGVNCGPKTAIKYLFNINAFTRQEHECRSPGQYVQLFGLGLAFSPRRAGVHPAA